MDKSVFLQEYCSKPGCGGRMQRELHRSSSHQDDNGGQIIHTQVIDRCPDCDTIHRQSPRCNFPCAALDQIFEHWSNGSLTRAEFDDAIVKALAQGGTYWKINAS